MSDKKKETFEPNADSQAVATYTADGELVMNEAFERSVREMRRLTPPEINENLKKVALKFLAEATDAKSKAHAELLIRLCSWPSS